MLAAVFLTLLYSENKDLIAYESTTLKEKIWNSVLIIKI